VDPVALSWLLPDGRAGAALPDGRTLRVDGGLPGDRVELEVTAERGRTVDGVVRARLADSPHRRAPPCPLTERCGGCDLGGAEPEARRAWLGAMLTQVYRRAEPVPVEPSPRPTGHRARITLHFAGGEVGYRPPRSHGLVPVARCGVARPEVQAALDALRDLLARAPEAFVGLTDVELRTDGRATVSVFEGRTADPGALAALGNVVVNGRTVSGAPALALPVDGVTLRVGPRSFFQVNLEANLLLGGFVREVVRQARAERVLDLYAGVGNLSLPLAAGGLPVVAVEAPGPGAEDLRHNARGLPVEVIALPAERFDPSRTAFDAVVLDPPRAGAPGVLAKVLRNRPRLVVYVSCFAPSAARDLADLPGYEVEQVRGFDLFPDTHHVESVVVLRRR
jgi:23S rRNA (uracil1939-C5)-methyltransferase